MLKEDVYIVSAKRTAIGSFMGGLKNIGAPLLGAEVIKAVLNDVKLNPIDIGEVIMGQVITGGMGQNPARIAAIKAELPYEVPCYTVNKVCGSGLKAICLGADAIISGNHDIIVAGGQENMSLGHHSTYIRSGQKFGGLSLIDQTQVDGLIDAFAKIPMGITAENIAKKFNISREAQDEFAYTSHMKAKTARDKGKFNEEIVPIKITNKKDKIDLIYDESIRDETSSELLSKLKSAFIPDGSITAGNSSSLNDGAACVILASEKAIKAHNLTPLAKIISYSASGVDPNFMGTGPVPAARQALIKANWHVDDLDVIESNEAFAAQAIYVNKEMNWDPLKVNINGGAIALGHPIGASGARVMVTLLHLLQPKAKGIATLCIGGGMGIAMCIEKL